MTRTLSQKALEKAAGEIHLATGEKMEWARPIARSAIAAYLDEVEREAPASDPAPAGWREALTPSAETKAAYTGEFTFPFEIVGEDEDGFPEPHAISIPVPWTTIKEIMAAILARALYAAPEPPAPVQSDYAIEAAHKILGNRQRAAVPEPPVSAPGHTDLMVSPESIDAFLETNPLPPEPPAGDGWQPRKTAPKDGTYFLAWVPLMGWEKDQGCLDDGDMRVVWFEGRGQFTSDRDLGDEPFTHWQPLPATPKGRESE